MLRRKHNVLFVAATCAALVAGIDSVRAQETPRVIEPVRQGAESAAAKAQVETIALKVDVVLARFQGTRKVSSLPYTLVVNAIPQPSPSNPAMQPLSQSTSLRLGVDVFTGRASTTVNDGKTYSTPEYQYVGTNIDCRADFRERGTYRVYLNLTDTALATASSDGAGASTPAGLRRFSASNTLTVRDGQSSQFAVGTDPLTGDTIRIDVTATAQK